MPSGNGGICKAKVVSPILGRSECPPRTLSEFACIWPECHSLLFDGRAGEGVGLGYGVHFCPALAFKLANWSRLVPGLVILGAPFTTETMA